jgi:alpha-D-ribose 1-methylphosphonate 5-triphosphate synthase subunit PhnL
MSRMLSIRNLTKSFTLHTVDGREVPALEGVDLDVSAGEHVALAGPSGAGKSSLLRCVYRTYVPGSGEILFTTASGTRVDLAALADPEVADLRGREIGYVSQFLRGEPRRGVLDLVARAGVRRGMDAATARDAAAEALRRLGIEERLWAMHTTVLSGGQKQRVNLAAGTISPPRLLLLDEPVSALDPVNREAVLGMIGELGGGDTAVLSVFHDLEAIERLATRVAVLEAGRIVRHGDPAETLRGGPLEVAR